MSSSKLQAAVASQPNLPTWLVHIWQRIHRNRLGLILGAGVSIDAGCPSWETLVMRLIRKARVGKTMKAHRKAGLQATYLTQILFSLHQQKAKQNPPNIPAHLETYQIDSTWMEIVHAELYKDISNVTFDEIATRHPYLSKLGELVCNVGLTVNFNFDDLVDEAAIEHAKKNNKEQPEIITKPKLETRLGAPVIYHINGSLPREARRRRSENLIFTEDAFADVLISPTSHDAEFIMSRFATTTFLLLGTSLNDNSLKNMLRGGMKRSPANHHYIVYWEDDLAPRSPEERKHIFDVNLDVYNLISIFLTTDEIAEFIRLLNERDEKLFEGELLNISPTTKTRRRYYLVGSVVAGKSTNLEALRCFTTFEEWSGRPPEKMYQDHETLTPEERDKINDWLYAQLREKNDRMRGSGVGIHIMDRAYLDFCAFSKSDDETVKKIDELRTRVISVSGPLETGHVIFLWAHENALSERQARRGKLRGARRQKHRRIDYDGKSLVQQSAILKHVYKPPEPTTFDTSRESGNATSRRIAREILMGKYQPFDFGPRMDEIVENGGKP